jgi:NADH:ubiquinone oxidoreductase subunit 4 (subunit M)
VTQEKNRDLPDVTAREKWVLVAIAAVILWMGIGSPFFTRRFAASSQAVLEWMDRPARAYEANDGRPSLPALPAAQISMERPGTR